MKIKLSIISFLLVILTGCEKEIEDILPGFWWVNKYVVDDIDSTNSILSDTCYFPIYIVSRYEGSGFGYLRKESTNNNCDLGGEWLSINDELIKITWVNDGGFGAIYANEPVYWHIDKLKHLRLEMHCTYRNKKYVMILTK